MNAKKSILVIEDERLIASVLAGALKRAGYAVKSATTAEDALAAMRRETFDAILLDLVLPDMHGFDFLRAVKSDERTRAIPVIIASNVGDEAEIKKGLALGAASYIVKANVLPEDIVAAVAKVVYP